MLKIGIIGTGHLGSIHLQNLLKITSIQVVGIFDTNLLHAQSKAAQYAVPCFATSEELLIAVDAVLIATPTLYHFGYIQQAIAANKHIFVEKPITATVEEAEKTLELLKNTNLKMQIGHIERFNPAFLKAKEYHLQPLFIEAHRLAQFNPRGLDVPVVLDLMIHDIDIVLYLTKSKVKNISASGVAIISDTVDIANARIEFENGAIANLSTSRISMKNMRKIRCFQKDAYISMDCYKKTLEVVQLKNHSPDTTNPFTITLDLPDNTQKEIYFDNPKVDEFNAIELELRAWIYSIEHDLPTKVTAQDGYEALKVAYWIIEEIEAHQKRVIIPK